MAPPSLPDRGITLVVLAAHHLSGSVASHRYTRLLAHLEQTHFRSVVICKPGQRSVSTGEVVEIEEVDGDFYDSRSSILHLLSLYSVAAFSAHPELVGLGSRDKWYFRAAKAAIAVIRREKEKGRSCIVIGSFCPLDAVVAAKVASVLEKQPLVLDFRDGLGFEPIGQTSSAALLLKRAMEDLICPSADLLITVSDPIREYLQNRFPQKRVTRVMTGVRPPGIFPTAARDSAAAERYTRILRKRGSVLVGYFGRLGLSDATCAPSLNALVTSLNSQPENIAGRLHFIFLGEYTAGEREQLARIRTGVSVLRPRSHAMATELMRKMDVLLLLTGNRQSVVTGKLFDYLSTSKRILLVSRIRNAASSILDDTESSFQYILPSGDELAGSEVDWEEVLSKPITPRAVPEWILSSSQAIILSNELKLVSAAKDGSSSTDSGGA